MKTLKLDEKQALKLYKDASNEFKQVLEDTFGKEYFNQSLFDKVKNIDDVYDLLDRDKPELKDYNFLPKNKRLKALTYQYMLDIQELFNGNWEIDWSNSNQYKWYPYFTIKSSDLGLVFYASDFYFHCHFAAGQIAFYKDRETSDFIGKTFIDIYRILQS